jgi:hypothetical protein
VRRFSASVVGVQKAGNESIAGVALRFHANSELMFFFLSSQDD